MKKASIITKMSKNYGAVLQAYAIKHMLANKGMSVNIINYNGNKGDSTYLTYAKITGLGMIRHNFYRFLHRKEIVASTKKFKTFIHNNFNLTRKYTCVEELREDAPQADVYVVGSDQVWNPGILFSPIYFLDFGPKSIKRISYAASFGKTTYPKELYEVTKTYLKSFDAISVREKQALPILAALGVSGDVVFDPTLMISREEWEQIEEKPIGDLNCPYILCYFLNLNKEAINVVNQLKAHTHYKIINIASIVMNPPIGDEERWDIGPEEFVWLIHHAAFVCTSSFHGTAFSIIFGKPFVSVNVSKGDSRLESLLELCGLTDRLTETGNIDVTHLLNETGHETEAYVSRMREISHAFLDKALN